MNESKINLEDTELPVPKWHQKLLFLIAGSDMEVLQQCPKTDWISHMTCGITILLTGMLAAVSAAYAVSLAFDGWLIPLLFGLFWGFMIMTYDRSIIISLGRAKLTEDKNGGWRTLAKISVRIFLAGLFSIMISKPLEIKLVEKRINAQMAIQNNKAATDALKNQFGLSDVVNDRLQKVLDKIKQDSLNILHQDPQYMNTNRLIIANLGQMRVDSGQIVSFTRQMEGYTQTPEDREALNQQILSARRHTAALKRANLNNEKKIGDIVTSHRPDFNTNNRNHADEKSRALADVNNQNKKADSQQHQVEVAQQNSTDILSNVQVLGHIADGDSAVWWFTVLFTLIIVCIELGPIILKLLSDPGPYDYIKEARNHKYYTEEQYRVDALNSELYAMRENLPTFASFRVQTEIDTETARAEKQLEANTNLLGLIVERQEELAEKYIEAWYQEELGKVNEQTQKNQQQSASSDEETSSI